MNYGEDIKLLARKVVRLHTGDLLSMEYPVEFVPSKELLKGGVIMGGPWFNCTALIRRGDALIIRATNGH